MNSTRISCIILVTYMTVALGRGPCVPRDYGQGTVVCVCNATYCDAVVPTTPDQLEGDVFRHYVTNKVGKRLEVMTMHFSKEEGEFKDDTVITIDKNTKHQEIFGFGGAMTDAAGINIKALSEDAQDLLLRQYFTPDGANYKFVRVPIGGSDFSTHYYAYDNETVDTSLQSFNLSVEDYQYKIPLLLRAQELSTEPLKLFSTAWSAPEWMKESPDDGKHTSLKQEYYQLWADYYVKFLDFYADNGLSIWGLTPQNEPSHGRMIETRFNSMGWTSEQQREWVVGNLAPTLKERGYGDIEIMILDDFRMFVPEWSEVFYDNETANPYVSGMALHWYTDFAVPASYLDDVHNDYPDKFLLYTESSCDGSALGDWSLAQQYISSIINVTNHYVNGWVDWNMAVDLQGGPNWVDNFDNAPILVNATADEFYKQPIFYALAHVSTFVPPGSIRVGFEVGDDTDMEIGAYTTPENITVVVIHNQNDEVYNVTLKDANKGSASLSVSAYSINTILYK